MINWFVSDPHTQLTSKATAYLELDIDDIHLLKNQYHENVELKKERYNLY